MGISPSELKDITPYEFHLFREGYAKGAAERRELVSVQSWVTYSATMGAAGKEPMPYQEWFLSEKNSEDSDDKSAKKDKELKSARKISAKRKAELEAAMNAIP